MKSLDCGRENDLISFLYDELERAERHEFGLHLQRCAGCSSQLTSFTGVRESVVEWRNKSLGSLSSVYENVPVAEQRKPSALAAIRKFFDLSPLWLKGTVAFASLLFCLFAVLAVARFSENRATNPVVAIDNSSRSRDEFNKRVEQQVQDELRRREAVHQDVTAQKPTVSVSPRRAMGATQLVAASSKKQAGRPLSRVERQELAVDLGLIDNGDEGQLVLIGDRLNQ